MKLLLIGIVASAAFLTGFAVGHHAGKQDADSWYRYVQTRAAGEPRR